MTKAETAREWARNFRACLSPESKLGALRGANRSGVLVDTLKLLKVETIPQLIEMLHQGEIHMEDTDDTAARIAKRETADVSRNAS